MGEPGSVAWYTDPSLMLSADMQGMELLNVVRWAPAWEYLLVDECAEVAGVLNTHDLDQAFFARL